MSDYEQSISREYVNGGEGERLRLERTHPDIVGLYEHRKCFAPWPADEAKSLRAMARQTLYDPQHAADHNGDYSELAVVNCATCVLHGWASVYADDETPVDQPNHAAWARIYVQAGATIPEQWSDAFAAMLDDENERYAEALGRDIATFGLNTGRGLVRQ